MAEYQDSQCYVGLKESDLYILTEFFKGQPVNLLYKDLYSPIGNQVASCIYKALSREPFDVHAYKV